MIEIFLFVNPIGPVCYQVEAELLESLTKYRKKIHLQLLPLVNLKSVGVSMEYLSMDKTDLLLRNDQTKLIYTASLDYKAAQLQGKKIARDFLLKLQQHVGINQESYSETLVEKLFSETKGDLEMFLEDRQSDLVKKNFFTDQTVAKDMGITITPSAVVYNFACEREYGVLLEGARALKSLPALCETTDDQLSFLEKKNALQKTSLPTLHGVDHKLILL
ncbi:DsbA family protein [Enterococcus sp. DIV0876]|uniref:DsbA family protein n=1 Tax=Enterococcus sp. DIV0876 TaxID=2774633 RepID=UPI003D2FC7B5